MSVFQLYRASHAHCAERDKLVLLSIADQANDEGAAWPVFEHLGMTDKQVQAALRRLLKLGLIRKGTTDGRETIYLNLGGGNARSLNS